MAFSNTWKNVLKSQKTVAKSQKVGYGYTSVKFDGVTKIAATLGVWGNTFSSL